MGKQRPLLFQGAEQLVLADGGSWVQKHGTGGERGPGGKERAPGGQADGCENGLPTWRAGMG